MSINKYKPRLFEEFKKDIVIDLVGYRRSGHNEADEPSITQPLMYKKIKKLPPIQKIYAKQLMQEGVISEVEVNTMIDEYRGQLDKGNPVVNLVKSSCQDRVIADWESCINAKWTDKVDTTISKELAADLAQKILQLPEGFKVHPIVARLLEERRKMGEGEMLMNWGFAEHMAYASLLHDGYEVRLSGQDCGRGTFAHRHAVIHDQDTGECFVPLNKNGNKNGKYYYYHENGKIHIEANIKDGKPDGSWTYWHENGKRSEMHFKDGKPDDL